MQHMASYHGRRIILLMGHKKIKKHFSCGEYFKLITTMFPTKRYDLLGVYQYANLCTVETKVRLDDVWCVQCSIPCCFCKPFFSYNIKVLICAHTSPCQRPVWRAHEMGGVEPATPAAVVVKTVPTAWNTTFICLDAGKNTW